MEEADVAELVVLNGTRAGAVFEIPEMPTVVGRSPEAHFQLDDPWISSMHAMFERRGDEIWVVDLDSRNGTYVGGERVHEAALQPGCLLRFGRTEVQLRNPSERARSPSRIPTPPSIPVSRTTSRLDAPEATGPFRMPGPLPQPAHRRPSAGSGEEDLPPAGEGGDALPVAERTVALLRMAVHLPSSSTASVPTPEIIRGAVDALQRAARDHGGMVLRLGATGALAVFGATSPSAEDAGSAMRAACAARDEVAGLGVGLAIRAAIDAGPVVLGNVHAPDGFELAVLGAVAERAERVLALAAPGEIVVGPGAIDSVEVGPVRRVRVAGRELRIARARS